MQLLVLVVFVTGICNTDAGSCIKHVQENGAYKLSRNGPLDAHDIDQACVDQFGFGILLNYKKLNPEEKALCGDQLVAYGAISAWENNKFGKPTAVNLQTGKSKRVKRHFKFSCILCQNYDITFPKPPTGVGEEFTESGNFRIHLTQIKPNPQEMVTEELKRTMQDELNNRLGPWVRGSIRYDRHWLDETLRLHIEYVSYVAIAKSVALGDVETSVFNGTYSMRVEDIGSCPEDDAVDVDGVVTHWPKTPSTCDGCTVQLVINMSTGAITGRHCNFNSKHFKAEWDPQLTRWELVWETCSAAEEFENEERYIQFLNSTDIRQRHEAELHAFATAPVDAKSLKEVAKFVEREVEIHNKLSEATVRDLAAITAKLKLVSRFIVTRKPRVSFVVADLKGSKPYKGFNLQFEVGEKDKITLIKKSTPEDSAPFTFDVSSQLLEGHSRIAFVIVWKNQWGNEIIKERIPDTQNIEVTVMFPLPGGVSALSLASYVNHNVDIKYNASMLLSGLDMITGHLSLACVAWNYDLRDWSSDGCLMLDTTETGFGACRCSGKYFGLQEGVPIARYALKKIINSMKPSSGLSGR